MRSEEVRIGGTYQAKVGGALRRVTVKWAREGSLTLAGRRRPTRYGCLTLDTGRIIQRTAAALRALPGTPEAAAAQAREAARAAKPRAVKPDWPAGIVAPTIASDGMLHDDITRATVRRAMGRLHVGDGAGRVLRVAHGLLRYRWRSVPRAFRRAILLTALAEHAANGQTYREVMRQPVPPSHSRIVELVMARVAHIARERAQEDAASCGEPAPQHGACPMCGGEPVPMGRLGDLDWARCRACGIDYSTPAGA